MTSVAEKQSFGQGGALFAHTLGTLYSGQFCALQVITDAKFETFDWPELSGDGDPIHNAVSGSAHEFKAGTVIYGQIKSFTLHHGAVLAYYSVRN